MASTVATLPHGLWRDGRLLRRVELRPLTGREEEWLADGVAGGHGPVQLAIDLLDRCARLDGHAATVPADGMADLVVGDREALVLQLRRATLGERMPCVVDCPACREAMDLDLTVGDLLVPPYAGAGAEYATAIDDDRVAWRVRFRLPTGADQVAVATVARDDTAAAREALLARCVLSVTRDGDGSPAVPPLPPAVGARLPDAMAALDQQAEIVLDLRCPACDRALSLAFDAAPFFFRELAMRGGDLRRDVHVIALHYHWSEAEILGLPRPRRQRYLGLIAGTSGDGAGA